MKEKLTRLGLLDSEATVYLTLVERGTQSAGEIASQTDLNRGTVYNALEELKKKGLVSWIQRPQGKQYEAADPEHLERLIADKEQELEDLRDELPSLSGLYQERREGWGVNVYEGIRGGKQIWDTLLDRCSAGDEWRILGPSTEAYKLGGYFKQFNERRQEKEVELRILYNEEAEKLREMRESEEFTRTKTMPPEYVTPTSVEVVRDSTLLVLYEPRLVIFEITNKQTADSFRQYFDALWGRTSD